MIRINLLKPLQAARPMLLLDEPGMPTGRKVALIFAVLLVLGAAAGFVMYQGGYFGENTLSAGSGPVAADQPKKSAPHPQSHPTRVTDQAVEELVREIQDEQALVAPLLSYDELFPSEKIEFQNWASGRVLQKVREAVPGSVGFADFIYTAPGEFYIRGLSYNSQSLDRFRKTLTAMENVEIDPGITKNTGASAREFSIYGKMNLPVQIKDGTDRAVKESRLPAVLQSFRSSAAEIGIRFKAPELRSNTPLGHYQKRIYVTEAVCDYSQLQRLLEKMHLERSQLGLVKFALHAKGDETMVASLDLLLYVD